MHIRLSGKTVMVVELKKQEKASIAIMTLIALYLVIGFVGLVAKFGVGILPVTLAWFGAVFGPSIMSAFRLKKIRGW